MKLTLASFAFILSALAGQTALAASACVIRSENDYKGERANYLLCDGKLVKENMYYSGLTLLLKDRLDNGYKIFSLETFEKEALLYTIIRE